MEINEPRVIHNYNNIYESRTGFAPKVDIDTLLKDAEVLYTFVAKGK